eukprot:1240887-Rhodomonas_salina.2
MPARVVNPPPIEGPEHGWTEKMTGRARTSKTALLPENCKPDPCGICHLGPELACQRLRTEKSFAQDQNDGAVRIVPGAGVQGSDRNRPVDRDGQAVI